MGVIAHVAGLPEARFDERLWEYADWDLFLALTEHRTPLELPAVAVHYRTDGDRAADRQRTPTTAASCWRSGAEARRATRPGRLRPRPAPSRSRAPRPT